MNWEAISAIGELIGAVAVLVTLIYLAVQVRQAKHEISLVGRQARANHAALLLEPLVNSDEMPSIFAKLQLGNYGDFGLTKEETIRFGAWFHTWLHTEQGSFYLLPEGANDQALKWMLSSSAGLEFWEKNKGLYDPPFVKRVEMLKAEIQTAPQKEADVFAGTQ